MINESPKEYTLNKKKDIERNQHYETNSSPLELKFALIYEHSRKRPNKMSIGS